MQKLRFTNPTGESLIMEYAKPYWLQNLVGLSSAPIDTLSSRGYQQDGQTAEGQSIQPRPVSFLVRVTGGSVAEVFANRRTLVQYFRPKQEYKARYYNDNLAFDFTCRIIAGPDFQSTQSSSGKFQTCTIQLICDDPYLYEVAETETEMAATIPIFEIPFEMPEDGIEFSEITNQQATIDNTGDVPTPVKIVFVGEMTNPIVTNETTGEYIKVNQTIGENEQLVITTGYGKKRVEIVKADDTTENAYSYIDLSSTFFELQPGENILSYDADSGADSAQVSIYFTPRYVGV